MSLFSQHSVRIPQFKFRMYTMKEKLYSVDVERKMQMELSISSVLEQQGSVVFAYLFGSFIDAEIPFHDIDLGVYFTPEMDRLEMSQAALELTGHLSNTLAFPVDVRVLNHAPVSFVFKVLRGRLIYERDENARCRVMENTVRSYLDIRPILHHATKEAFSHGSSEKPAEDLRA